MINKDIKIIKSKFLIFFFVIFLIILICLNWGKIKIIISRQNLEAELNYSSLRGVGQYWRNEYEIEKLQCNLIGVNLQEDFFKLERRHYNIINNIKNNKIKKELDSTKDNLL